MIELGALHQRGSLLVDRLRRATRQAAMAIILSQLAIVSSVASVVAARLIDLIHVIQRVVGRPLSVLQLHSLLLRLRSLSGLSPGIRFLTIRKSLEGKIVVRERVVLCHHWPPWRCRPRSLCTL